MYNSREIGELRADVAVNCRTLIERAAARGLPVLVVQTVRDAEYQRYLVSMGYAARTATVPTFHAKGVGLAFDICKNVKGHEYDDPGFFTAMGRLGKEMGFTWGGDWRSFPDRPHFQWDANGRYSSSMILAGKYPPQMEEYDYMDQDKFDAMMDTYLAKRAKLPVDEWATEVWAAAYEAGVVNGTAPKGLVTRQEVIAMIARSK